MRGFSRHPDAENVGDFEQTAGAATGAAEAAGGSAETGAARGFDWLRSM